MSDLGGSHSWLVDVGGGVPRAMREAPATSRPTDEQVERVVGARLVARAPLRSELERLRLSDGTTAVLKVGGFWRSGRERQLYEQVLRPETHGSPRLIAAGEGWVLLEDLGDPPPVPLDDLTAIRAVYGRLAEIHASGAAALELDDAPLSAPDAAAYAAKADQLAALVERAAADPDVWELGGPAIAQAERLRSWVRERGPALAASGRPTLLHGDYQRGNWLLTPGGVRVVDWELAATGPGILDLYYLSPDGPGAGHAPAGPAAVLAFDAYRARLTELGQPVPPGELLPDAPVWGSLAAALARLTAYYADEPLTRAPRGELPDQAAALLRYAAAQAD